MYQNPKIETYQRLVREYARVLDLVSPRLLSEFEVGVQRSMHFADWLEPEQKVLDIGSGVGLPAIPLAILRPDIVISLCERRVKRAAFLERAVSELGLTNVTVYNTDVQRISGRFDLVTALWVGSLTHLYELSEHLFEAQWSLLTRKGSELQAELKELKSKTQVIEFHVKPLDDGANLVLVRGER